jgi:hypothetical protein
VSDITANLKPWPKGVSGNPGGRPKKKAITEELERLLEEEAPNGDSPANAPHVGPHSRGLCCRRSFARLLGHAEPFLN